MTTKLFHYALLTSLIITGACNKDNPTENPSNNPPDYLLKSISWSNGMTAHLSYHADSSLKNIDYTFQSSSGKSVFTWSGKKLTEFYSDRSLNKNLFEYDQQGRVIKMHNTAKAGVSDGYFLEFKYNAQNKLDSLKFFFVNIVGEHLQSSTSYHYSSAGELEAAITKTPTGILTHSINTYSPPVSFNPCNYIETTLSENYIIYNYALMCQLSKVNKLPTKVTRTVKNGSQPSSVDKIEEQTFTVTNHRIDKVVTAISFPAAPGNNATIESVYSYF